MLLGLGVRLSAFNVYLPGRPDPDSTLIYNTFTGGFAVLESAALDVLRKADAGIELEPQELSAIDPDLFDESVGVLVESREAEESAWRAWYEKITSRPDALDCIVSTTFACNLDCTYCCQSDVLSGKVMTEETARKTAAWLARRALEIGTRRISINFVGGEPLLQPERIEQIVNDVRARVESSGVEVKFFLITNGVFLTRQLVEKWLPLGLEGAQVTLDGDETTHSLTRRSRKRGEDTFATIFHNLVEASRLIGINVNGNYTRDTVHGFLSLIEKLREAGLPPGSQVKFGPALTALGAPSDSASGSCLLSHSMPEYMLLFGDAAMRAGFYPGDPMTFGPCGFHQRHLFAIDPEGHIYMCPGFLGKAEWAVGHVAEGLDDRYDEMVDRARNVQQQCGSCAHRPECAGGCLAAEWLKQGKPEGIACEQEYYTQNREHLVMRKYLVATSESPAEAVAMFPPVRLPAEKTYASPTIRRGDTVALRVLAA